MDTRITPTLAKFSEHMAKSRIFDPSNIIIFDGESLARVYQYYFAYFVRYDRPGVSGNFKYLFYTAPATVEKKKPSNVKLLWSNTEHTTPSNRLGLYCYSLIQTEPDKQLVFLDSWNLKNKWIVKAFVAETSAQMKEILNDRFHHSFWKELYAKIGYKIADNEEDAVDLPDDK